MEKNLEYWVLVRFQFFDVKGLVLFGFGVLIKITGRFMFSFSLQCMTLLVGRQEGRPAGKKPGVTGTRKQSGSILLDYGLCWWWWFDWSFARLTAPVVTTTSIVLICNKIQNGNILVLANRGLLGKWPLKLRERFMMSSSSLNVAKPGFEFGSFFLGSSSFPSLLSSCRQSLILQMSDGGGKSHFICLCVVS